MRLANGEAPGVAGGAQRHFGGGGHDDGQRTRPEASAREDLEARRDLAREFLNHQRVAHEQRQCPLILPALGVIDLANGAQVERIGNQGVERVGWDSHYLAEANCGLGAIQRFSRGCLRVNLNEIGSQCLLAHTDQSGVCA